MLVPLGLFNFYIHDHKLNVVCLDLLRDLRYIIRVHRTATIGDKDYFSLPLQLLAVLRDHLYGNDNSRYR